MSEFNYMEIWALEEPMRNPHEKKADELGLYVDDIPVSPVLTRLEYSRHRIEEMYNVAELKEEGINVDELLDQFTEIQVMQYLEEMGFENAVSLGETESLLMYHEWQELIELPRIKSDFFQLRQFEEAPNGKMVDVSVFNTVDFWRMFEHYEFDKYKYFTDKVAEKAEDLAIMHSCITDPERREDVKKRFEVLVSSKFGNSALRLISLIHQTSDSERMSELLDKLHEKNRQIRRLHAIWNKHAYNW